MAEIALVVEPRTELGSRPTRRLRSRGFVPAVIYGHGDKPLSVSVDGRALRTALSTQAGDNALFNLRYAGDTHLAIARELQRHALRHTISHVDFQVVSRDELVPADVPINLVGEALGVTRAGGNVEQALLSLHVHAKPGEIPPVFEVDITDLVLGAAIRVSDIALPAGVSTDIDAESPVVIGQAPRGAEVEAAAEGAEASTGEAAPPAPAPDER